jgi:glycosyltransferase involved in cell wall biosynthesis
VNQGKVLKSKISHSNSHAEQPEKIRVCFFSTVQLQYDVRLFYRECRSLVKAGYDVHLVVPCEKSELRDGVQFHAIKQLRSRMVRMIVMPWVAMRKALQTDAAIYHFHDPELLFVGFFMRWVFLKRVVFDMRESTARQILNKEWLPRCLRRFVSLCYSLIEHICLKGVAVIVANDMSMTEHKGAYLVRNFPEIDEELIGNAAKMKERMQHPLLIYVGGVWDSRGAFIYVDLIHALIEMGHDIRMMIIGDDFGFTFDKLNEKIKKLGLQEKIQVTGRMEYREAMKYVCQAVIGLAILKPMPNYTFCLAGKMVEYMMCGTPVLCSRFEHWRPYVEDERTGMMVDPNNIDEIVKVCERMLIDPDELAAMGKRGMETVRTKYNWDTEFKVLLRCYEDLLKKG